ncbi:MAG TPA: hypothetical protein VKF82_02230 [Candidatus Eremiobacteraceae bacterium]|nr:hypothetical protein [Candidatus Eremiobacteraceae bacterium]
MSFSAADIRETSLIVLVLIVVVGLGSYFVTRRMRASSADDAPFGVILAAAFALVGLLLGFSFSLALSRYDARRQVTVQEANAIGTTILRVHLLQPSIAVPMWSTLREYVQARIDFAAAGTQPGARDEPGRRSAALQSKMWSLAMSAAQRDPHSTMVPLFIQTLNAVIDLSAEQDAALSATIPDAVLVILICVVLIAAALLGANFGRVKEFDFPAFCFFAAMLAVVIATILDLDRPQGGFIKVPLTPLQNLQPMVAGPPPVPSGVR